MWSWKDCRVSQIPLEIFLLFLFLFTLKFSSHGWGNAEGQNRLCGRAVWACYFFGLEIRHLYSVELWVAIERYPPLFGICFGIFWEEVVTSQMDGTGQNFFHTPTFSPLGFILWFSRDRRRQRETSQGRMVAREGWVPVGPQATHRCGWSCKVCAGCRAVDGFSHKGNACGEYFSRGRWFVVAGYSFLHNGQHFLFIMQP